MTSLVPSRRYDPFQRLRVLVPSSRSWYTTKPILVVFYQDRLKHPPLQLSDNLSVSSSFSTSLWERCDIQSLFFGSMAKHSPCGVSFVTVCLLDLNGCESQVKSLLRRLTGSGYGLVLPHPLDCRRGVLLRFFIPPRNLF